MFLDLWQSYSEAGVLKLNWQYKFSSMWKESTRVLCTKIKHCLTDENNVNENKAYSYCDSNGVGHLTSHWRHMGVMGCVCFKSSHLEWLFCSKQRQRKYESPALLAVLWITLNNAKIISIVTRIKTNHPMKSNTSPRSTSLYLLLLTCIVLVTAS